MFLYIFFDPAAQGAHQEAQGGYALSGGECVIRAGRGALSGGEESFQMGGGWVPGAPLVYEPFRSICYQVPRLWTHSYIAI